MIGVNLLSEVQPAPAADRHWKQVARNRETQRLYHVPRLADQWSQLAQAAEQLLAARRAKDPASIAKRRMTPDDARQRERVMAAVVAIWRDVERLQELVEPIDWPRLYGASWDEILIDLRGVAKATTASADQTIAGCAIALSWHFEPIAPGALPHIWLAADHVRHTAARDREAA